LGYLVHSLYHFRSVKMELQ